MLYVMKELSRHRPARSKRARGVSTLDDQEADEAVRGWISNLLLANRMLLNAHGYGPMPGSPFYAQMEELGERGDFDPVTFARATGEGFLHAAGEQLQAMMRLVDAPPLPGPFTTVARAALEASARAWWIFDEGTDTRTRVQRVLCEGMHSAEEQAKLMRDLQRPGGHPWTDEMNAEAERWGLAVLRDSRGRFRGVGEPRKTTTELMELISERSGRIAWRIGSAVGHATLFASMAGFAGQMAPDASESRAFERMQMLLVTATVVGAFGAAGYHRCRFYDWPAEEWTGLVDSTLDEIDRGLGHLMTPLNDKG